MSVEQKEFSRILATASALGEEAANRHRFLDKRVLLTGDEAFLATQNGRECFMAALHLLPRVCANVVAALPRGTLRDEALAVGQAIAFRQPITFVDGANDEAFEAILNVGSRGRIDAPWTVIHNDGWLVRVASNGHDLPTPTGQINAMASLAAASLGVAEVFKRLLGVRASRGPLHANLSWSLFTYTAGTADLGPHVPGDLPVDMLLAGAGAIGNGVLYLLRRLPLRGRLLVVDAQTFGPENLGTCVLIGSQDLGSPKAALADRLRGERLDARGFHEKLEDFSSRFGPQFPHPRVILGALDKIDPRHAIQDLWPDLLIDGAIGPLLCQVSRHPIEGDVACARCLFRQPPGERAEAVASRATGLTVERASMPDALVEPSDVDAAPAQKREWLATQVGKPVCSVVSEAVTRELSDSASESFEPSVPFVATLASSMMVGEFVKDALGAAVVVEPRFQFDVLRGPGGGLLLPEERRGDCFCRTRASTIASWRASRPLYVVPTAA